MTDTKKICTQLVKDYCANSSFAGIHFIGDDTKHWIERILWVVLVILSWYGSALLIIAAWESFVLSPISFGVDTVYTDWNTKMPYIAICENSNNEKVYSVADSLWNKTHLIDLEDVLKEIAFYRGASRLLLQHCYTNPKPDHNCPLSNYSYLAKLVRNNCSRIMKGCSYNGQKFSCCEYFLPIQTDIGPCFIINSVQTTKQRPYPMVINKKNKKGTLKFMVSVDAATVYTLGEEEVPTITTTLSSTIQIKNRNNYSRTLAVRNIDNDPLLSETTIEQRACRFDDENQGGLYPKYSYSACTVLCRKKAQLEMCKCNDHFMLNTTGAEECNITGLACHNTLSSTLTTLKPPWARRPGLSCDCLPSCDETEITVINDASTATRKKANVEIVLAYMATERFKRNVIRSRLDLVVSVGGTTGLFVGASILSFVELFFFFTVRLFNNLRMNRDKNRNNNVTIVKSKVELFNVNPEEIEKEIKRMNKDLRHEPFRAEERIFNSFNSIVRPYQH